MVSFQVRSEFIFGLGLCRPRAEGLGFRVAIDILVLNLLGHLTVSLLGKLLRSYCGKEEQLPASFFSRTRGTEKAGDIDIMMEKFEIGCY